MSDQTQKIVLAKGGSKVHGPFMVTCSACGGRYWPEDWESHLAYECFPSPYRIPDKAPAERKTLGLAARRARKPKQP